MHTRAMTSVTLQCFMFNIADYIHTPDRVRNIHLNLNFLRRQTGGR